MKYNEMKELVLTLGSIVVFLFERTNTRCLLFTTEPIYINFVNSSAIKLSR